MMKSRSGINIGTGITSIIMIFVVLCLVTFSILSYSTARADYLHASDAVNSIDKYYEARNKATRDVADIMEIVGEVKADEVVKKLNDAGYNEVDGVVLLEYTLSDKQVYKVEVEISSDTSEVKVKKSYVFTEGGEYNSPGIELILE